MDGPQGLHVGRLHRAEPHPDDRQLRRPEGPGQATVQGPGRAVHGLGRGHARDHRTDPCGRACRAARRDAVGRGHRGRRTAFRCAAVDPPARAPGVPERADRPRARGLARPARRPGQQRHAARLLAGAREAAGRVLAHRRCARRGSPAVERGPGHHGARGDGRRRGARDPGPARRAPLARRAGRRRAHLAPVAGRLGVARVVAPHGLAAQPARG
ncbi:hypothetical protein D3C74_328790 [compost metagenome]